MPEETRLTRPACRLVFILPCPPPASFEVKAACAPAFIAPRFNHHPAKHPHIVSEDLNRLQPRKLASWITCVRIRESHFLCDSRVSELEVNSLRTPSQITAF